MPSSPLDKLYFPIVRRGGAARRSGQESGFFSCRRNVGTFLDLTTAGSSTNDVMIRSRRKGSRTNHTKSASITPLIL